MANFAVRRRIQELCQERGITINKLASITGITQSTLNDFINGRTNTITIRTINRICKGLGISIYEFFNSDEFKFR